MAKYRIDDSFEIIGAFWKFGQQNDSFTGTLRSHKGRVQVLAAPAYIANMDGDAFRTAIQQTLNGQRDLKRISSICGFTTDNLCTLLECLVLEQGGNIHFPTGQRLSGVSYIAARTVMGLHVESADAMSIEQGAFYLTKVYHILPTPWAFQITNESTSYNSPRNVTEVFRFTCTDINSEVICEVAADRGSKIKKVASIRSVPRIRLIPDSPQSVNWFTKLAFRIENFFTLLMGTSVSVKRLQVIQGEDSGWVVQTMKNRKEKVDLQTWVRCPPQGMADALAKWLAVPVDKQAVELVVLGMVRKSRVFAETEFLSFAQALEGFGRISSPPSTGTSFASLIKYSYDLLSADFAKRLLGERAAFTANVVQTRNYYTHLGNTKGSAATKNSEELFYLNKLLQAFLRCVMLIDLGVSEQYLKEPILYQATRWKLW
jgi:ApeA N-terminal domain 1